METLGKAVALFWKYPKLWMPMIVADSLTFGAKLIDGQNMRWLASRMANSMYGHSSVLSESPSSAHMLSPTMTFVWVALGLSITMFAESLLLVIALHLTVRMVRDLFAGSRVERENAELLSRPEMAQILRLTTLLFGINLCGFILLMLLAVYQSHLFISVWFVGFPWLQGVLWGFSIAWLGAPFALRFAANGSAGAQSASAIRLARWLACAAAVLSWTIYFTLEWFIVSVFATPANASLAIFRVIQLACLPFSSVPYVVLFIAFALLTQGDEHHATTVEAASIPRDDDYADA